MNLRLKQFALGVSAGLTAQALRALWQWLRAPGRPRSPSPERR
jgi:hypothetical protein